MNTAVILSGLSKATHPQDGNKIRVSTDWKLCSQNIIDHIIKPYNADVFIHTEEHDEIEKLIETYKPKDYMVDFPASYNPLFNSVITKQHSENFGEFITDNYIPLVYAPPRTFAQYYSLERSNFLKRKFELQNKMKYDVVVRCRFDLKFNIEIKLNPQLQFMDWQCNSPGLGDIFFSGPSEDIDKICNLYNKMYDIYLSPLFSQRLKEGMQGCMHLYSAHAMLHYHCFCEDLLNKITYPGWNGGYYNPDKVQDIEVIRGV